MKIWKSIKHWYVSPRISYYTIKWVSFNELRNERIRNALNTKKGEFLLEKDFYKDLSSRKVDLEKTFMKVCIAQLVIWLFTFFSLIDVYPTINVAGLTIKSEGPIREIALVLSAFLGFLAGMQQNQISFIELLLNNISEKKVGKDLSEFYSLYHSSLIGRIDYENIDIPLSQSYLSRLLNLFYGLFIAISLIYMALIGLLMNLWLIYDVWMNPSFGGYFSYVPISLLILTNVSYFLVAYEKYIKLPYRDYSNSYEVAALDKAKDKDALIRKVVSIYKPSWQEKLTGKKPQ